MLDLDESHEMTPQLLLSELETARRILSCVTALADKRRVEAYIEELHRELVRQTAAST